MLAETAVPGQLHFASYYRWLIIRDWLRVNPSDHLLDVGCDDGELTARVRAALRVAVDLNPRCPDPTVRLARSDATRLPVPAGRFQTVTAFDLIEHVPDDAAVLAEMLRALAPGGTLWISTSSGAGRARRRRRRRLRAASRPKAAGASRAATAVPRPPAIT